jgi:hypothetical protein
LWFNTRYFAASLLLSFVAIVVYRRAPSVRVRPLPPVPHREARSKLVLVLGEPISTTCPGVQRRASGSRFWNEVDNGIMILGAMGP